MCSATQYSRECCNCDVELNPWPARTGLRVVAVEVHAPLWVLCTLQRQRDAAQRKHHVALQVCRIHVTRRHVEVRLVHVEDLRRRTHVHFIDDVLPLCLARLAPGRI